MSSLRAARASRQLSRYQVIGELATGGMAEILLAKLAGPKGFERLVVIKRILPHLAKKRSFIDMFVDEARICASIHQKNVVQVHELCQDDDELFLVMEYLEGESLSGLIRRLIARDQQLNFGLVAHIIAEACAGLHAAHELCSKDGASLHVVHRDISPQNLFITFSGEVKVLDFGIAKASGRITDTKAGTLKGKFAYMSPEQCRGNELDRRSDLFSLGTVLHELSTCRQLFGRDSDLMILKAICEQDIVVPSQRREKYPKELERICMKALARSRRERYQDAAEMRQDLFGFLHGRGLQTDPERVLAQTMRELFSDRIAEKREMVSRIESGCIEISLPAVEADLSVEVPGASYQDDQTMERSEDSMVEISIATGAPERAASDAVEPVPTSAETRSPIVGLLVALLLVGGAGAFLFTQLDDGESGASESRTSESDVGESDTGESDTTGQTERAILAVPTDAIVLPLDAAVPLDAMVPSLIPGAKNVGPKTRRNKGKRPKPEKGKATPTDPDDGFHRFN